MSASNTAATAWSQNPLEILKPEEEGRRLAVPADLVPHWEQDYEKGQTAVAFLPLVVARPMRRLQGLLTEAWALERMDVLLRTEHGDLWSRLRAGTESEDLNTHDSDASWLASMVFSVALVQHGQKWRVAIPHVLRRMDWLARDGEDVVLAVHEGLLTLWRPRAWSCFLARLFGEDDSLHMSDHGSRRSPTP